MLLGACVEGVLGGVYEEVDGTVVKSVPWVVLRCRRHCQPPLCRNPTFTTCPEKNKSLSSHF